MAVDPRDEFIGRCLVEVLRLLPSLRPRRPEMATVGPRDEGFQFVSVNAPMMASSDCSVVVRCATLHRDHHYDHRHQQALVMMIIGETMACVVVALP